MNTPEELASIDSLRELLDLSRRDCAILGDSFKREKKRAGAMERQVQADGQVIGQLRERAEKAEAALREIEELATDWTVGSDENMSRARSIASGSAMNPSWRYDNFELRPSIKQLRDALESAEQMARQRALYIEELRQSRRMARDRAERADARGDSQAEEIAALHAQLRAAGGPK